MNPTLLSILKTVGALVVLIIAVNLFGAYGVVGFVIIVALLMGYRILTNWEGYMALVRHTETKIWGRPLDKVYGKPPKVKLKWGKKK